LTNFLNISTSGLNQAVHAKTTRPHITLQECNSDTESCRELFKGSKDSASCVVCNEKNLFWGVQIFCQ